MFSSFMGFVLCTVWSTYILSCFIRSNYSLPQVFLGSCKGCPVLMEFKFYYVDTNVVGQGLEGGGAKRKGKRSVYFVSCVALSKMVPNRMLGYLLCLSIS
jgi:hypothetical protein